MLLSHPDVISSGLSSIASFHPDSSPRTGAYGQQLSLHGGGGGGVGDIGAAGTQTGVAVGQALSSVSALYGVQFNFEDISGWRWV